jgi:hypothetical protein
VLRQSNPDRSGAIAADLQALARGQVRGKRRDKKANEPEKQNPKSSCEVASAGKIYESIGLGSGFGTLLAGLPLFRLQWAPVVRPNISASAHLVVVAKKLGPLLLVRPQRGR